MDYPTRKEEMILLAVFHLKEAASLVSIRKHLTDLTGSSWSVGNIYVPLDRLTRRGLLQSRVGEPNSQRGGKAVKYYGLAPMGRRALRELKEVHETLWDSATGLAFERKDP